MSTSVLALLLAAGCTVGDITGQGPNPGGDGDGDGDGPDDVATPDAAPNAPDAAPPDYALTMAPADAALTLGEEMVFTVTLSSERFDGPVTLSADGVPDSWIVTFNPSDVIDMTYDGTAIATMTVSVPTDAEATTATVNLNATAAPGERTALASVAVANELIVSIADGVSDGQHNFPGLATVRLGATIKIVNGDGTPHRIHSNSGDEGFPHQPDEMNKGESHEFTITQAGQYDYYCHEHDVAAGVGAFKVVNPQ